MQDDGLTINEIVRTARRAKLLSQSALATAAGCTQSAISMFEAGRADALSSQTVEKVAEVLGIDANSVARSAGKSGNPSLRFCPADGCPANVPYVVQGRLILKPSMVEDGAISASSARCRYCGEALQDRCPNTECGVALVEGSFCAACGMAYVTVIERDRGQLEVWADAQRGRIREVRELSRTERTNRGGQLS